MQPIPINSGGNGEQPFEDGANWRRIRLELVILDILLEHAITRRVADPRKQSLNPFQGVILDSTDILSSLATDGVPVIANLDIQERIRPYENQIAAESVGLSRLGYLSATLGLQHFEERCLVLALAPELFSRYSEIYAYWKNADSGLAILESAKREYGGIGR